MPRTRVRPTATPTATATAAGGRRYAVTAGILLLVATASSLLSQPFLAPLDAPDRMGAVAAHPGSIGVAALLDIVAALTSAGIALALYPVLRRNSPGLAVGAVGFRVAEGTAHMVGIMSLLALVTVSRAGVAAGPAGRTAYTAAGDALYASYHWTVNVALVLPFTVGGLLYYLAFYRSRLVPRWLSVWGVVGVVLLVVATGLLVFDVIGSVGQAVLAAPIGVQELVLAVWLLWRGFAPDALDGLR